MTGLLDLPYAISAAATVVIPFRSADVFLSWNLELLELERDLLSFDGDDIAELAANFKMVVDEYLDDCAERGVEAEVPKISIPA